MGTFFIADLHLSVARPEMVTAFLGFLEGRASRADALYILGDLFDQWLGDDDETVPHPVIVKALARLTMAGVPVSVMHGNHDFLLAEQFARQTGCQLLPDQTTVDVYGTRVLIMHGDTLCIDDREYQALRTEVRDADNQARFLALPLAERAAKAALLRATSKEQTQLKPLAIMDVNQAAVVRVMREHGVLHLIHGHTHRPAIHSLAIDGRQATRIVLGDWYERANSLLWDEAGYRVLTS